MDNVLLFLSFLSVVLIPFLVVLLNDLRKLFNILYESIADDGIVDLEEMQQILSQVGVIFKLIFKFWRRKNG